MKGVTERPIVNLGSIRLATIESIGRLLRMKACAGRPGLAQKQVQPNGWIISYDPVNLQAKPLVTRRSNL